MNKKNIKILILVISSCILLVVFLYAQYSLSKSPLSKGEVQKGPKALSGELASNNIQVSLIVQDKKYETKIQKGRTVFDLMKRIKEENKEFDFKYEEHAGLGIFINEINGKIGGGGGYWIYYINGAEANVGISNYKINNGDKISWKYEK